jgi:hypothetical protein
MNPELDALYNEYKLNPVENIGKVIEYTTKKHDCMGYFFCGTHYMTTEKDWIKAFDFLYEGLMRNYNNNKLTAILSYNLGYLSEQILRSKTEFQHPKYEGFKSCCAFYDIAIKLGTYQAANQLGKLILDYHEEYKFDVNKGINYLKLAADKGIIQAINNLITYYKDDHIQSIKYLNLKYKTTSKIEDLMMLMISYLNNKDFKGYCNLVSLLGQTTDVRLFLKGTPYLIKDECSICYDEKDCYKLKCTHIVCNECLFNIFKNNPVCPLCRCEL